MLLPGQLPPPAGAFPRSGRVAEIAKAARQILEHDGPDALTMRRLGDELGIQAPSLYKHFNNKAAVELALVEDAILELGFASHRALRDTPADGRLEALLWTYRTYAAAHPHLYRLATAAPLRRDELAPGVEEWAGNPWYVVAGDPALAQALWSFAHGMVILEIDGRYPPGSDLDATWAAGVSAFKGPAARGRARLRRELQRAAR